MVAYMFGGWIDAVCGSVSPIIYWAISAVCTFFFFFFLPECGDLSQSLCFTVPTGSNKLQTCFLSSNSTFAAPSLRHRPYHYPRKQHKNASAISVLKEFLLLPSVSRLYQASLWWGLTLNAQNHKENPHL